MFGTEVLVGQYLSFLLACVASVLASVAVILIVHLGMQAIAGEGPRLSYPARQSPVEGTPAASPVANRRREARAQEPDPLEAGTFRSETPSTPAKMSTDNKAVANSGKTHNVTSSMGSETLGFDPRGSDKPLTPVRLSSDMTTARVVDTQAPTEGATEVESETVTTPEKSPADLGVEPTEDTPASSDTEEDTNPEGVETPSREGFSWEEGEEDNPHLPSSPTKAERKGEIRRQYWQNMAGKDVLHPDKYSERLNPVEEKRPNDPPKVTDPAYQHHRCPPPEPAAHWGRDPGTDDHFIAYFHDNDDIFGVYGPIDRPVYAYSDSGTVPLRVRRVISRNPKLTRPYRIATEEMLRGTEQHLFEDPQKEEQEYEKPVRYAFDPASNRLQRIYPPYPDITDAERRLRLQCPSIAHTTNPRTNPFRPSQEPYRIRLVGNQVNWVPDPHLFEQLPRQMYLPPPDQPVNDERGIPTSCQFARYTPAKEDNELRVQCEARKIRGGVYPRCSRTWHLTERAYDSPERYGPHRCPDHAYEGKTSFQFDVRPLVITEPTWTDAENPIPGSDPYRFTTRATLMRFTKHQFEQAKDLQGWVQLSDDERAHALRFYGISKLPYQLLEPQELRRLQWSQANINCYYHLLEQSNIRLPAEVKAYRAYYLRHGHDQPWTLDVHGSSLAYYRRVLGIPPPPPL